MYLLPRYCGSSSLDLEVSKELAKETTVRYVLSTMKLLAFSSQVLSCNQFAIHKQFVRKTNKRINLVSKHHIHGRATGSIGSLSH